MRERKLSLKLLVFFKLVNLKFKGVIVYKRFYCTGFFELFCLYEVQQLMKNKRCLILDCQLKTGSPIIKQFNRYSYLAPLLPLYYQRFIRHFSFLTYQGFKSVKQYVKQKYYQKKNPLLSSIGHVRINTYMREISLRSQQNFVKKLLKIRPRFVF